jgi:hypothetical protein
MRRYAKPPAGGRIDLGHRMAPGLVGAFAFSDGSGLYSRSLLSERDKLLLTGNTAFTLSEIGNGIYSPNSGSFTGAFMGPGFGADVPSPQLKPPAVTCFWRGIIRSNGTRTNNPVLAGMAYDNANTSPFLSYAVGRPGSDATAIYFSYASPANTFTPVTGLVTNNVPLSACLTHIAGSSRFYANGRLVGSDSTAGDIAYHATLSTFVINRHATVGGDSCDAFTDVVYVWNRVLSADENLELADDPHGLIIVPSYRRHFILLRAPSRMDGGGSMLTTANATVTLGSSQMDGGGSMVTVGEEVTPRSTLDGGGSMDTLFNQTRMDGGGSMVTSGIGSVTVGRSRMDGGGSMITLVSGGTPGPEPPPFIAPSQKNYVF